MKRALIALGLSAALLSACGLMSELQPDSASVSVKEVVDLQRVGDSSVILSRPDSFVTLVAHVPAGATVSTVSFTASAGFFVLTGTREATVRLSADSADALKRLAARVQVRRDTSAFAIVSATVANYRDTVRVLFR